MNGDRVSDVFEAARARLTGRAYRIVGSFADADDVVQEAWLRWDSADQVEIDNADAWLNTVVSRLAIDRLRQRKRDEERYTGPWLPTPLVERSTDPADLAELTDSMTSAFLIMLEELTPDERAAFLLADVFGDRYDSIAASMGRTPESCRQLASRARRKVRAAEQRRRDATAASNDLARRFITALATGDEAEAVRCLAPEAVYLSDGGPDHRAARRPVREPARIVRLLMNLWRRFPESWTFEPALVGGFPGLVIEIGDEVSSVTGVEVVDGRIVRITSILNPDKLVTMNRPRNTLE
ncbi:RNA polymerase ECF family sigma subunit [Ilumatobacter fluminis]|uniref:RNA polymerase ECF family sigma subunit n=1 Tax=Ilumatobacter fluminis TaxID=467091 RepID=A0A4R7HZR7_9ACTN|nr:RNA polymerase ECF family sigma subunit [Ilumatobacter fluminis]